MKEINIARSITGKRKEKGITQDELAEFIGVSKASVSKWETGHSYPDIVFLPQLASYFNITVDELIGYEPQMTDRDIRKLYMELANDFGIKPFAEVKNRCHEIVKKYHSCFPLVFRIGVLILNNGMTSKDEERKTSAITEAKELFIRVKTESDNIELKQLGLHAEATCEMMLGNHAAIIDLLKDVYPAPQKEDLLAQAYLMAGKVKEAKTELQISIYRGVMGLFDSIPPYLTASTGEPEQFEEICKRAMAVIEAFNLKALAPAFIMPFYLTAAQGYAANGNSEKALGILETYSDLATGDIYPLKLIKNDGFFTLIEDAVKESPFDIVELPRDEKSIKQSMADEVTENPVFAVLSDEPRFKRIAKKLRNNIG